MKKPEKSRLILAALLSLSLLLPAASAASEKIHKNTADGFNIGFVDLSILLAFHPLMQFYSIDDGVFIKPFKKGLAKKELLKEAAGRAEKRKTALETGGRELKKLQAELDSIEAEIKSSRAGMSREQDDLNRKYTAGYTAVQSETERAVLTREYHKALSDVDAGYRDAQKKSDEKKKSVRERISEISGGARGADYLDGKASRELLNKISAEIEDALKETADEAGVGVILNSAAVSPFTPPEELKNENYMAEDANLKRAATEVISSRNIFAPSDGIESGENAGATEEECRAVFAKRGAFVESIMKKGVATSSNRMFAHGGENLTLKAIEKILRKYSVPQLRIDKIIKTIKMMSDDFEHTYDTEEKLPAQGL